LAGKVLTTKTHRYWLSGTTGWEVRKT